MTHILILKEDGVFRFDIRNAIKGEYYAIQNDNKMLTFRLNEADYVDVILVEEDSNETV